MTAVCEILSQAMDEQNATLMIQLQLEDTYLLSSSTKGKSREDELSDAEIALQLYQQELEVGASIISDRRMTQSIAYAVQADGRILTEALLQEDNAVRDREVARRLTDNADLSDMESQETASEAEVMDDELLEKLAVLWVSGLGKGQQILDDADLDVGSITTNAESSSWAANRSAITTPINHRCVACREDKKFFDVARVPCRHEYCRDCLEDLFQMSLTDESLFPPRCCRQPIPMKLVRMFLESQLVQAYEAKKIEIETPNRTYCCSQICSAFIQAESITDDVSTCLNCSTTTCTTCKAATHVGDCPSDTTLQQVLEIAAENGWQRCYSCWRVVELDHGCNHMTLVTLLLLTGIHVLILCQLSLRSSLLLCLWRTLEELQL